MPLINRVRIVNFSYNNNFRHIIDECFNFYGGENALLSLANGGGKSVLVQAILQPILPKASLLGRKFSNFFIGSKAPSYIMIEWKLEEDAGYLLTGIAVTTKVTHSTDENDQNGEIRYFTFTSFYEDANEFDIRDFPVSEQSGNSIRIASFSEFKKMLQKESEKGKFDVAVFESSKEEQYIYEKKLISYSIFRDEWKELMMKINEAEHGVSEVFSECKTSRKVMEQWVIKFIEKVLDKSSEGEMSDHKKLEVMMGQVAQALVENEKHIKEYNAISEFRDSTCSLAVEAEAVLKKLDDEERITKELSCGYAVLKSQMVFFENRLKELEINKRDISEQLSQIDQEKRSEEYYRLNDEISELNDVLARLKNNERELNNEWSKQDYRLKQQQAAEKYGLICEKQSEISELNERIANASKNQDELNIRLNQAMFSMKCLLQKELDKNNNTKHQKEQQLNSGKKDIYEIEKKRNELLREQNRISTEMGRLSGSIETFEREEKEILKGIGIQLYRNPILKELDSGEIKKVGAELENDLMQKTISLKEMQSMIEKYVSEIDAAGKKKEKLQEEEVRVTADLREAQGILADYKEKKKNIIEALKRFNIREEYLFDHDYIVREAKEYRNSWENKIFNLKMEIGELDKRIHGIEAGESYLPAKLLSIMKDSQVEPYTGEKYLREVKKDRKQQILEKNPLLPYALIVTEKEQELLKALTNEQDFGQLVPLIRHNDIEDVEHISTSGISFLAASKNACLDGDSIKAYIDSLCNERENVLKNLLETENVINRVNRDFGLVEGFVFSKEQEQQIYEGVASKERELEGIKSALSVCAEEIKTLNEKKDELGGQILETDAAITAANGRIEIFKRYLERNTVYMEQLAAENKLSTELDGVKSGLEKLNSREKDLREKVSEVEKEIGVLESELKKIKDKMLEVKDASETEVIEASIHELEGILVSLRKGQSGELEDLRSRKKSIEKDIREYEKQIDKLNLGDSDEYKTILYSEEIENQLQEKLDKLKKDIENTKNEYNAENVKLAGKNTQKNEVFKQMEGRQLVPEESIRGNFEARKKVLKAEQDNAISLEQSINKEKQELLLIITKIDASECAIRDINDDMVLKNYQEVIKTIKDTLSDCVQSKRVAKDFIMSFGKESDKIIVKYENSEEGTIRDALKGLKGQLQMLEHSFDKYYYLSERLSYYNGQLLNILSIMESKLQQLEHSRKDLIEHAFMEAKRIYMEIPKISENSAVEIDGVRKRILEISYKEMEDELAAREKMSGYISECLNSLTTIIKENADENKMRRELEKYMSTRELFNVISPLESCEIKAYKVDLNEKNRRMLSWEEIIVKNSGGEKFVAYFSLLVALISYSRRQQRGSNTFKSREESKVLIMDNPFGPITSGHLLKPMFDIAKKYNTQLICLSDIKQGDVINSFDLIYMVKIRQNMNREDYLELEPILQRKLSQDERLEKAYYHYIKPEQMRLFE